MARGGSEVALRGQRVAECEVGPVAGPAAGQRLLPTRDRLVEAAVLQQLLGQRGIDPVVVVVAQHVAELVLEPWALGAQRDRAAAVGDRGLDVALLPVRVGGDEQRLRFAVVQAGEQEARQRHHRTAAFLSSRSSSRSAAVGITVPGPNTSATPAARSAA